MKCTCKFYIPFFFLIFFCMTATTDYAFETFEVSISFKFWNEGKESWYSFDQRRLILAKSQTPAARVGGCRLFIPCPLVSAVLLPFMYLYTKKAKQDLLLLGDMRIPKTGSKTTLGPFKEITLYTGWYLACWIGISCLYSRYVLRS